IVNFFRSCGHQQMVWIDLNEPDVMYSLAPVSFWEEEGVYVGNIDDGRQYPLVSVYTRIDAPLNEPEENYLSRLKIFELAHKLEIPAELFFDFYLTEDNDESYFIGAGQVFFAPIYLVSETSDKIVLASEVIHWQSQEISDAVIMIEKIGDEWVRTTSLVEYDMFPDL
ncbi:MAG: hypothetical protein FWE60_05485, partial [Oscillospiraceae bacterium]|nr:hypothetical protein [Oscillospiraceae bacterium]